MGFDIDPNLNREILDGKLSADDLVLIKKNSGRDWKLVKAQGHSLDPSEGKIAPETLKAIMSKALEPKNSAGTSSQREYTELIGDDRFREIANLILSTPSQNRRLSEEEDFKEAEDVGFDELQRQISSNRSDSSSPSSSSENYLVVSSDSPTFQQKQLASLRGGAPVIGEIIRAKCQQIIKASKVVHQAVNTVKENKANLTTIGLALAAASGNISAGNYSWGIAGIAAVAVNLKVIWDAQGKRPSHSEGGQIVDDIQGMSGDIQMLAKLTGISLSNCIAELDITKGQLESAEEQKNQIIERLKSAKGEIHKIFHEASLLNAAAIESINRSKAQSEIIRSIGEEIKQSLEGASKVLAELLEACKQTPRDQEEKDRLLTEIDRLGSQLETILSNVAKMNDGQSTLIQEMFALIDSGRELYGAAKIQYDLARGIIEGNLNESLVVLEGLKIGDIVGKITDVQAELKVNIVRQMAQRLIAEMVSKEAALLHQVVVPDHTWVVLGSWVAFTISPLSPATTILALLAGTTALGSPDKAARIVQVIIPPDKNDRSGTVFSNRRVKVKFDIASTGVAGSVLKCRSYSTGTVSVNIGGDWEALQFDLRRLNRGSNSILSVENIKKLNDRIKTALLEGKLKPKDALRLITELKEIPINPGGGREVVWGLYSDAVWPFFLESFEKIRELQSKEEAERVVADNEPEKGATVSSRLTWEFASPTNQISEVIEQVKQTVNFIMPTNSIMNIRIGSLLFDLPIDFNAKKGGMIKDDDLLSMISTMNWCITHGLVTKQACTNFSKILVNPHTYAVGSQTLSEIQLISPERDALLCSLLVEGADSAILQAETHGGDHGVFTREELTPAAIVLSEPTSKFQVPGTGCEVFYTGSTGTVNTFIKAMNYFTQKFGVNIPEKTSRTVGCLELIKLKRSDSPETINQGGFDQGVVVDADKFIDFDFRKSSPIDIENAQKLMRFIENSLKDGSMSKDEYWQFKAWLLYSKIDRGTGNPSGHLFPDHYRVFFDKLERDLKF